MRTGHLEEKGRGDWSTPSKTNIKLLGNQRIDLRPQGKER